mgnify:CR=1 FL=1
MYNITELNDMPDDQLKAVAEGMGLKKIDLSDKEGLVYRILDQQAIDRAAATTAKRKKAAEAAAMNEDKQPKKRGRKKKETQAEQAQSEIEIEQPQPELADSQKPESAPAEGSPAVAERKRPKNAPSRMPKLRKKL